MLNPNLASKVSFEGILNNSQNDAVHQSGVLGRPGFKDVQMKHVAQNQRGDKIVMEVRLQLACLQTLTFHCGGEPRSLSQ